MLPRGREAGVAVRREAAHAAPPPLPLACFVDVLSLLAPGERLLASAVSRAWRDAVCQPCACTSIDFTCASPHRVSDALLAAVVRKAAGRITNLRLRLCQGAEAKNAALAAVVLANSGALRRLELLGAPPSISSDFLACLWKEAVDSVLHAAPSLVSFHTDVRCIFHNAQLLLAARGQYSVVHLRQLVVDYGSDAEVILLARDIRQHPSLREVGFFHTRFDTPVALGELVDVAIACGLTGLQFAACAMGPQSGTHLARLLRDAPRMSSLLIEANDNFDAACIPAFAAALSASSSLTVLRLEGVGMWRHVGIGTMLVDAFIGHSTLREISLESNPHHLHNDPQNLVSASLARLVAANSKSLQTVSFGYCFAGDGMLRPIFEALPSNTFLRNLSLRHIGLLAPFARDVVLPSVLANSSLRRLEVNDRVYHDHALVKAERVQHLPQLALRL